MKICSKCLKRLLIWITLTTISVVVGLILDMIIFNMKRFPFYIRIIGFIGILSSHFLLKRSGKLIREFGKCELWGWSTKLITHNIYKCTRHPHHLGVGLFMTFLGLLIAYPFTFIIITFSQWLWVVLFVLLIEEKECVEKFGEQYLQYKKTVPLLIGNPICIIKELCSLPAKHVPNLTRNI